MNSFVPFSEAEGGRDRGINNDNERRFVRRGTRPPKWLNSFNAPLMGYNLNLIDLLRKLFMATKISQN